MVFKEDLARTLLRGNDGVDSRKGVRNLTDVDNGWMDGWMIFTHDITSQRTLNKHT